MLRKVLVPIAIVLIVALVGIGGYFLVSKISSKKVTLTVWTLDGTQNGIKAVADEFTKLNPDVGVKIVPMSQDVYEERFLYALAARKAVDGINPPDVLVLPNESYPLHRTKLVEAPVGALDNAIHSFQPQPSPSITPDAEVAKGRANAAVIKQDYGPIATQDLVVDGKVYGVPLNSDSLALFYNKSHISQAPKTWTEVIETAKRLTQKNGDAITRSGVALGDNSVVHALDIISILMLQNNATMVKTAENSAGFNLPTASGTNPGVGALDYFTSFAKSSKESYSWNSSLGNSLTALKSGKTSVAFGYASDISGLGQSNIATAVLPQVDTKAPKTYGRYLAVSVTKQASDPVMAWKLAGLFANPDIAKTYAATTKTIPARIDTSKRMTFDAKLKPFVEQVSITTNWPKKEVAVADGALIEALNLVKGGKTPEIALDVAAKAYTSFLQTDSGIPKEKEFLSLWQSSDDTTDYKPIVADFLREHKEVTRVIISKHDPARLEWELLNAMAARLGPDVVAVPSSTVARLKSTIKALPTGTFKPANVKATDAEVLSRLYVPSVADDNFIDGKIYGMPPAIETLYLAYNPDLFRKLNDEKIKSDDEDYDINRDLFSQGPTTWEDLKTMARVATDRDGNKLINPFISLGTGANVEHAADIYAAFTKQAGGDINNPDKQRSGIQLPISSSDDRVPGQEALDYILSFSDPKQDNFTWNKDQPNSLNALADGLTMMAFIYPRDLAKIQSRNPNITLEFFPLPQIDTVSTAVDFASNFSLVVPNSSTHSESALQFIVTAAASGDQDVAVSPLKTDEVPIVIDRLNAPLVQKFQANTANSYYRGNYPVEINQALTDLLDRKQTLTQTAAKLNQLFPKALFAK